MVHWPRRHVCLRIVLLRVAPHQSLFPITQLQINDVVFWNTVLPHTLWQSSAPQFMRRLLQSIFVNIASEYIYIYILYIIYFNYHSACIRICSLFLHNINFIRFFWFYRKWFFDSQLLSSWQTCRVRYDGIAYLLVWLSVWTSLGPRQTVRYICSLF